MRVRVLVVLSALLTQQQAFAWGQQGHRITGAIAEQHLSPAAKAWLKPILVPQGLANMATYPDDMRSNPDPFWQHTADPYHYVTLSRTPHYHPEDEPAEGDAISALRQFTQLLQDSKTSVEDKRLALSFVIHIIGDLHQPLHVSDAKRNDRGGNKHKVQYFGKDTNLHSVWDSSIIDSQQLSYTEYSRWLNVDITPADIKAWQSVNPMQWIHESSKLNNVAYPAEPALSWGYNFEHLPTVEMRLKQAGVRIAAYLDALATSKPMRWPATVDISDGAH